jgi:hypothetical protein
MLLLNNNKYRNKIIHLHLKQKMIKNKHKLDNNFKEKLLILKRNMILKCKKFDHRCKIIENRL